MINDPHFTGPVRQGHVIIAWSRNVSYHEIPRHYDDWGIARLDAEHQLRMTRFPLPGTNLTWKAGIWNGFPALHLLVGGKPRPYLLIEQPLIRAALIRDVHYAETEELHRT